MNALRHLKYSKDADESMIEELSALLRERGVKILSGETKLALTTTTLNCLNRCFHRLRSEEAEDEIIEMSSSKSLKVEYSFHDNVQYLFDFIKRIFILKITQGTSTLQGSVDVTPFINLKILEIKRIPIHLFVGLKSLRNQLQMITCERCLPTLEDLFSVCGGDRCSSFSWPELLSANLSYNGFESLDTSLRLLPSLVSLNISHNLLENTVGLEYLNELEYLNLSYNRLQQLPRLSIQACARLKVLSLRNNNLESLDGLEKLSNLLQIDLAYNCLLDHCSLSPFLRLQCVRYILLEGNPISFHECHRMLTIEHLHHKARTAECILDRKTLKRVEITNARKLASSCCSFKNSSCAWNDGASINSVSEQLTCSTISSDPPVMDKNVSTDEGASFHNCSSFEYKPPSSAPTRLTHEKKRVRKGPVVRDAEIDDSSLIKSSPELNPMKPFDTSETESKLSPHPMEVSGDHLQTKEEIEKCRRRHGKEWLIIGTKLSVLSTAPEPPNIEDIIDGLLLAPEENEETLSHRNGRRDRSSEISDDVIVLKEESEQPLLPPPPQNADSSHLNNRDAIEDQILDKFHWEQTPSEAVYNEDDNEEAWSSPFIMQIEKPETDDTLTVLVVICERDIREKDFVTGRTIERLELRSIRSLDILAPKISVLNGTTHKFPRIRLTFNYVRAERKERIYIMEDDENYKQFLALLKPVIDAMTFEEMTSGALQCLKCASHFSKEVAKRVVRKSQRPLDDIVVLSSSADTLKEHLSEETACPNCGSEMLIESDHSALLHISSNLEAESTHFKYLNPASTEKSLLGAPVNQSTPLSFSSREPHKRSVNSALGSSCPANYANDRLAPVASQEAHLHLKSGASPASPLRIERCSVLEVEVEVHTPRIDLENEQDPRLCSSLTHTQSVGGGEGLKRTESDITILSNPSQSSILVMPNPSTELTLDAISESSLDCNRQIAKLHLNMATAAHDPSCLNIDDKKYLIPKQPSKVDSGSSGSLTGSACTAIEKSFYESHLGETPDSFISALSGGEGVLQSYNLNLKSCDYGKDSTDNTNVESTVSEESTELINDSGSDNLVNTDFVPDFNEIDHNAIHKNVAVQSLVHIGKPLIWSCQNGNFNYSFQDFGQIDHRLKLHLDLEVLNADDELVAVLRGGVVPYMKGEEWPGLLVISKTKVYIMQINGPEIDQPKFWLQKFAVHPISLLCFLNVRLGSQAFQLEFGPKSSPVCYTFILRDADNCNNFVCFLMEKLKGSQMDLPESQLQIGSDSDETLQTIREQLLSCLSDKEISEEVDESPILHYVMGYWTPPGGKSFDPVSFVTTSSDILIFTEDFHWPLPNLIIPSTDVLTKSQLTLLTTWKIQDLAAVEHVNRPLEVALKFFDEDAQEESVCTIALETEQSLRTFLEVLRNCWEKLFGVELQITNSENCCNVGKQT